MNGTSRNRLKSIGWFILNKMKARDVSKAIRLNRNAISSNNNKHDELKRRKIFLFEYLKNSVSGGWVSSLFKIGIE